MTSSAARDASEAREKPPFAVLPLAVLVPLLEVEVVLSLTVDVPACV
jgi:hypothetical protein